MWSWLREYLKNEAGKYVAGAIIAALVAIAVIEWGAIQEYASVKLLDFVSASLTADPDFADESRQTKRTPAYSQALREFQGHAIQFAQNLLSGDPEFADSAQAKPRSAEISREMHLFQMSVVSDLLGLLHGNPDYRDEGRQIKQNAEYSERIRQLQKTIHDMVSADLERRMHDLVGYAQTGTFQLAADIISSVAVAANGVAEPKSQFAFTIFASDKSKVSLEFDMSGFDKDRSELQIFLFDRLVCRAKPFQEGFNRLLVEILNVETQEIRYLGKCPDQAGSGSRSLQDYQDAAPHQTDHGHMDDVIPVRFKLVPKQLRSDSSPDRSTVTVAYIAMVSPLLPSD